MTDLLQLWLPHLIGLGFVFALGGCVGSFVNVTSLRIPEGMSVVAPPSRCPICGRRLTWYQNLPILGWIFARGRCWSCRSVIPFRYVAIELIAGGLFAAYYAVVFVASPSGWWAPGGAAWFQSNGFLTTLPAFLAVVFLLGSLLAATLTDLRSFTIPLAFTLTPTVLGLGAWTIQGLMTPSRIGIPWPIPLAGPATCGLVIGAGIGVLIALFLLWRGAITRSFGDYHEHIKDGELLADYPHARREMVRELVFLAPIVVLGLLGWLAGLSVSVTPPLFVQSLCSAGFGYLVAAGMMWLVRVVATSIKGIEAMGMGDVHLMGAAGAVLGWVDPVIAFFLAPFSGLGWIAISGLWGAVRPGTSRREIPYGPHLALAIVVVVLLRPLVMDGGRLLFPGLIPAKTSLQGGLHKVK
ncbi:MAG: prepilin peptidase [Phycisphaerales bacterium]|nr:prepilin peptidase [Phycisphaerales bacterium]